MFLLKATIDSIPSYWFNLFKLPVTVLSKLEQIRRDFLWGHNTGNNVSTSKMHLLNWEKICVPKNSGGLGIVPLKHRNISLLAKWWWRCYNERNRLWNRLLSEKYGAGLSFDITALTQRKDCSFTIKNVANLGSAFEVSSLISRECFMWKVGEGNKILFWEDYWLENGILSLLLPRLYRISKLKLCSIKCFAHIWRVGEQEKQISQVVDHPKLLLNI